MLMNREQNTGKLPSSFKAGITSPGRARMNREQNTGKHLKANEIRKNLNGGTGKMGNFKM